MFQFLVEPELSLLTVTRNGSWSLDTVKWYEVTLRRELESLRLLGGSTAFIIDIRSTRPQARDVAAALRAMVERLGPLHADRTAVVTSSGTAKLQAKWIADVNTRIFTSMLPARNWARGLNSPADVAGVVVDEPSDAHPLGAAVHVHGPSDVDFNLTPTAALETAKRINRAAMDVIVATATKAREPRKGAASGGGRQSEANVAPAD